MLKTWPGPMPNHHSNPHPQVQGLQPMLHLKPRFHPNLKRQKHGDPLLKVTKRRETISDGHHLKRPPFFWEPLPKVNKYKNMDIHMKNTKRFLNIMACFNANWRWWWIYPKMLPLFHRHRLGSNCFRCHFLYGNSLRAKRVCNMFSCTISSS